MNTGYDGGGGACVHICYRSLCVYVSVSISVRLCFCASLALSLSLCARVCLSRSLNLRGFTTTSLIEGMPGDGQAMPLEVPLLSNDLKRGGYATQ